MSTVLKALIVFLQALTSLFSLFKEKQLREEGEREAQFIALEEFYKQQNRGLELEKRIQRSGFTDDELDRVRKYERSDSD